MIRKKQCFSIILLSFLLALVVSAPAVMIRLENDHMAGEISFSTVEAGNVSASGEKEYDLWEQIQISQEAAIMWTSGNSDFAGSPQMQETDEQLVEQMEKQLERLQSYGGLPQLAISKVKQTRVTKSTYVQMANEKDAKVLEVWEIYAVYPDFTVCAYMDGQTKAVYDISVTSSEKDFRYSSDVSGDGFWEYINAIAPYREEGENVFRARGVYQRTGMHLCLFSQDADKQQTVFYCFHTEGNVQDMMVLVDKREWEEMIVEDNCAALEENWTKEEP